MTTMTPQQLIGACLIAAPFVAIFVVAWRTMGLRVAIVLYAATAALIGIVGAGVYLTTGSLQ